MKIRIVHDIPLSPTIVVIFVYLIDERWCRSKIFQFHRQNVVSHSQDHRLPDQSPWVKIVITFLWLTTFISWIHQDAKLEDKLVVAMETRTSPSTNHIKRRRRRRRRREPGFTVANPDSTPGRKSPPIRARGADATSWARSRSGWRLLLPAQTGSDDIHSQRRS